MKRLFLACALAAAVTGCDNMPGKPDPKVDKWHPPQAVTDFQALYKENCQGCHGQGSQISGSFSLDNPVYLSVLPAEVLRSVIANGVPGSAMPGFAQANGGMLTDAQIDILVQGILAWAPKPPLPGPLPPYAAAPGDAAAGQAVFAAYTASVEKAAGPGVVAGGFYANPAFLGLVSDQYLRTLILAGRPELGIPDFRTALNGQPLSDQDIADVVAWLISQRRNEFGQPLPPGQR
jgi:mono/diheme cytochrome c family protein